MTKRAYAARAARPRIDACAARLRESAPGDEVLVIGPSRVAVDELVFGALSKGGASFGVHRKTLFGLAVELAGPSLAAEGIALAPPLSVEAVVRRVTRRALASGKLSTLARASREGALPIAATPNFPLALRATLEELRLGQISPAALDRAGAEGEVAYLYEELAAELERAKLADRRAIYDRAAREVAGSAYAGLPLVMLDVSLRSVAERELCRALLGSARDVVVTCPQDDAGTKRALEAIELAVQALPPSPLREEERSVASFRARLFENDATPLEDARGVALTSAADELLEAMEIARRCAEEAQRGVRFDEMAVLVPPHGAYAAHLEAAFDRAKIPAYFEVGVRRPHPGGRALSLLLRAKVERGSGRRLGEYLATAQMPSTPVVAEAEGAVLGPELDGVVDAAQVAETNPSDEPEAELRIPFRRWERMLGELGVGSAGVDASLADYVKKRIGVTRRELLARPELAAREDGDAIDEVAPKERVGAVDVAAPRLSQIERELASLEDLERRLVPLLGLLDAVPSRAPWGEHLEAIARLAPQAIRRPELALAILEELAVLAGDDDPVDLSEVLAVLEPRLASMERAPLRRGYGRVLVTRPAAMRGRARKVVLLCGVGERIFPERVREDPILLDRARQKHGDVLATRHARSLEQRGSLAIAVGAAEERFFASFPRGDAALGRSRVASLYALEIARVIMGEVPDLARLEEQTKTASGARLAWPAPTDPRRALDDLEYELALAKDVERRPEGEARGRLRFLLGRHKTLDRALRFRFWRHREGVFAADGLVAPSPAMRERFAKHGLRERAHGPSSLEAYATCPYRFYLRSIMRLDAREEVTPVERLEPMTRGGLYHLCQAEVAKRLSAEGTSASGSPERARALFDDVVHEVAESARERLEPLIAQVFDADVGALLRDLLGSVDESERSRDPFAPLAQELRFGEAPSFVVRGGYRLRGAIDAVEIDRERHLRITDYKTGRVPEDLGPFFVVKGGEVLQPILYALAVEALIGTSLPSDTLAKSTRLYFATERGGYEAREIALDDEKLERGREALEAIDRGLRAAVLLPIPREKACDRCDYRAVCGDGEERRSKKFVTKKGRVEEDVIASLASLRRMP